MTRHFRILRDQRGATLVEFAFVAPVLIVLVMGLFDIGFNLYTRSVLQGEVQKAGRDSSLETGASMASALDARITSQVKAVASNATMTYSRKAYKTFTDAAAARAENFTDGNNNGRCDSGETFVDANGNGTWDSDGSKSGQGSAKDAVLYTATATYPRMFPMATLLGWSNTVVLSASTVLINQPYSNQATYSNTTGTC